MLLGGFIYTHGWARGLWTHRQGLNSSISWSDAIPSFPALPVGMGHERAAGTGLGARWVKRVPSCTTTFNPTRSSDEKDFRAGGPWGVGLEARSLDPSRRVTVSHLGSLRQTSQQEGVPGPAWEHSERLLTSPPLGVTASWAGHACPSPCALAPGALPDLFETGKIYLVIQYCKEISSPPINVWTE